MKISNSKKQLAKIIHENGGWRDGVEWATQDKTPLEVGFWLDSEKPHREPFQGGIWVGSGWSGSSNSIKCADSQLIKNWHQTILSRDEYLHLYPAPVKVVVENKTACHLTVTDKPTLEQLAADYRNAKDYADRKQQEADAAKADAEAKLAELVAAGKAHGLVLSVAGAEPEPGVVITDWRDLRVGDIVWWSGDSKFSQGEYRICDLEDHAHEGPFVILLDVGDCRQWVDIAEEQWRFIRRPAKGGADA